MTINDKNYRLTKHGRKRYIERVGTTNVDSEIIQDCVNGKTIKQAVWKPALRNGNGLRLVTVLPKSGE